ncbi:MAG: prepilin-type N-terminal cleavage/methylation domain-containing protein [Bacilli bacterium]
MIIKNKQTSFTLIELLVVIVIIGILAGLIMISTSSSINKASIAKAKVFDDSTKIQ